MPPRPGRTWESPRRGWTRAKANLDYAKIVAPFDGVVTHRTFHPGALIRSATEGGQQPLLTVKRTDLMRVVVLVPDGDVVLTKVGDTAVVSVDALGGRSFTGTLARIARAEDAERMMRVEIDLPNPDNVLCDGMYGKAVDQPRARCQEPGRAGGLRRRAQRPIRRGCLRRPRRDRPAHRGQAGRRQRHLGRDPLRDQARRFHRASLRNAARRRDARHGRATLTSS